MPSMSSQFALSLEVTRLVPLALAATNSAAAAVMKLARDLQDSGSDLITEEDLAEVFGRSRIEPQLASSFKTVVVKTTSTHVCEGIILQSGPGPTVSRALGHPPYFSTVVQLSLLSWVHEKSSLAESLRSALESRMQGAPADYNVRATPSQERVLGVVVACEEQTSAFDWGRLLLAVASMLGLPPQKAYTGLSPTVLRAVLDMFPIVQSLPEHRLIHVEDNQGICSLCVWAHHVLGLTVLVKLPDGTQVTLGNGTERVVVDCGNDEAIVSLLDSDTGDILITIEPDSEGFPINAIYKIPAKGYGRFLLLDETPNKSIAEEMMLVTVAFAVVTSQHLVAGHAYGPSDPSAASRVRTNGKTVIEAAQFLFDDPRIDKEKVEPYILAYGGGQPLDDTVEAPSSIAAFRRSNPNHIHRLTWSALLSTCRALGVAILAFAYLRHRDSCEKLPLGSFNSLRRHKLVSQLDEWDGKSDLVVTDDMWISVMWLLTTAHEHDDYHESTCLLSDHGWSVFLSTFGDADPAYVDPGYISVVPGVPCRNGIRKRCIVDGPCNAGCSMPWETVEKAGETSTLRCVNRIERSRTLIGERRDMFAVSVRLKPSNTNNGHTSKERDRLSGFREFHKRLWLVQRAGRCQHVIQMSQELQLSPGTVTMRGYDQGLATGPKVVAFLTARNRTARWRAVIGARSSDRRVLLRGDDCCFACVLDQAALEPGSWAVIL